MIRESFEIDVPFGPAQNMEVPDGSEPVTTTHVKSAVLLTPSVVFCGAITISGGSGREEEREGVIELKGGSREQSCRLVISIHITTRYQETIYSGRKLSV